MGRTLHRHRIRMHRTLHGPGVGATAHLSRRKARFSISAGEKYGRHSGLWHQSRRTDSQRPDRIQRVMHDQLPGPYRQATA